MTAPWPRIVRGRIIGARRDRRGDWRRSKYQQAPGGEVVLTLDNMGDRPLQSVRCLSDASIARAHPSPSVQIVSVVRWWVTDRSGRIEVVVGPVNVSPANFVGGVFIQHQANPLCPCQRHNVKRRAAGVCVCVVNGVIAPCAGVQQREQRKFDIGWVSRIQEPY